MTIPTHIIWACALVVAVAAAWTDWRTRRIPNWLTVPAMLAGIAINSTFTGWHGAKVSLEGMGLGLGLLLPLVLLRGLGAGDWKLMGAIGAVLGPARFVLLLLASLMIAGIMGVVEIVRQGKIRETAVNLAVLVQGFFTFGLQPNARVSLDAPGVLKLPFGVATALATALCYGVIFWHLK